MDSVQISPTVLIHNRYNAIWVTDSINELNTKMNDEIRIRGQIIALSLKLEDILTKIIYSTFKPICENEEVLNLYLEEFILPIAFGKKISLFK